MKRTKPQIVPGSLIQTHQSGSPFPPADRVEIPEICSKWLTTLNNWAKIYQEFEAEPLQRFRPENESRSFAVSCFKNELALLRPDWEARIAASFEDPKLARTYYVRIHEWAAARLRFYIYLSLKECPAQKFENKEIASASFAGLLLSERVRDSDNILLKTFLRESKNCSPKAYQAFVRWAEKPRPAGWKYPLLDAWLMSIWPIVQCGNWNYRGVWLVANRKFDSPELRPFETADRMSTHCKSVLGLRVRNTKAGRPRDEGNKDEASLPFMAELALQIPAELPDDSLFREMGK
ncbi:MAG: hypothetical protein HY043_02725 [Verrucomicrobia bacterium]|nr:hypothetical protein [Verrucomicrobiota bacterium]